MKKLLYLSIIFSLIITNSCGNSTDKLQQRVDSLENALQESKGDYNELNGFLTVISDGFDSILVQEQGLIAHNPESPLPNREDMKQGLQRLKETISQQRERINQLEQELINGKGESKKLKNLIAILKQQIEEKDEKISNLLAQLENSNMTVKQLTSQVAALNSQNEQQQSVIQQQEETMQVQDQAINEAYIKIGTKKELKSAGILSGGFLKKNKIDYSQVDQSIFQKVDIRQVTEIPIPSKDVKVLTPVPTDSYNLQKNGDVTTLTITNPTRFWSVSKFLIIQTK